MSNKVKVKMLVSIAGNPEPRYDLGDFSFSRGQIVELHPALAQAWIGSGSAKAVLEPETTTLAVPETAVLPEAKPKKRAKKEETVEEVPGEVSGEVKDEHG